MSRRPRGFLTLDEVSLSQIEEIFILANQPPTTPRSPRGTAALLFFEPSTRTRMSFELAALQSGWSPVVFQAGSGTSMEKGETPEDSTLNVAAMGPDFVVVRCGDSMDLRRVAEKIPGVILNAGWGQKGHPTQALGDFFTLRTLRPKIVPKVLYIGDLKHSRVFRSHAELLPRLGGEARVLCPASMEVPGLGWSRAGSLEEGLRWANVVYLFRYQKERHQEGLLQKEAEGLVGLRGADLKHLSTEALIMHPGPVNRGMELDEQVYNDPRSVILRQVTAGTQIRRALFDYFGGPA